MNINKKRSYDKIHKTSSVVIEKQANIKFQRIFSVASKDPTKPCEECGTILNDIMNKKICDRPKKKETFICSHCCQYLAGPPKGVKLIATIEKVKRPRGWHLLKCYVDAEGNYFEFGEEKPELKGTEDPTFTKKVAEPKPKGDKLTKKKKLRIQHSAAAILFELKKIDPIKYDKKNKKVFESYLNIITQIASGNKFPKNHQEIIDKYDKEIRKL